MLKEMIASNLDKLAEFKRIVGESHVLMSEAVLNRYSRSSGTHSTRPLAIVLPGKLEEVQEVVQIASRLNLPVYPISRGNNWGYGDACAVTDGHIILDLRRMDKIVEVNDRLAYAIVEPGVTQGQLSDYLREHHPGLIMDVTGAGPDTSVLGNVIERGFGHTPIGDHFTSSAGYEVILADGSVVRTGFSHFKDAKCGAIFKAGVGPSLDGLFTQSNLGIVTKMAVYLYPKPDCIEGFIFSTDTDEQLKRIIDALRPLRIQGIIQSTVHIINDLKAISSMTQCPEDYLNRQTALTQSERRRLRRRYQASEWNGFGGIYGNARMVKVYKQQIKDALRGLGRIEFISRRKLKIAAKFCSWTSDVIPAMRFLGQRVQIGLEALEMLAGVPVTGPMIGAGWRSSHKPVHGNMNPLDNHWGSLWLSPMVPMTSHDVQAFLDLVRPLHVRYGFDPILSLSMLNPRILCCVMAIAFNKERSEDEERARQCYTELLDTLMRAGYIPYRIGIGSMDKLRENSDGFWQVASQIKQALDPQGILAPGRYIPS